MRPSNSTSSRCESEAFVRDFLQISTLLCSPLLYSLLLCSSLLYSPLLSAPLLYSQLLSSTLRSADLLYCVMFSSVSMFQQVPSGHSDPLHFVL